MSCTCVCRGEYDGPGLELLEGLLEPPDTPVLAATEKLKWGLSGWGYAGGIPPEGAWNPSWDPHAARGFWGDPTADTEGLLGLLWE